MKVVRKICSGFTLIELLVVIAIIAILAAILFPVFSRARDKAQQAACVSNLKQVGQSLGLYIDDYDEQFPKQPYENVACPPDVLTKMHWRAFVSNLLLTYTKNREIFLCEKGPKRAGSNAANYACSFPTQYLVNIAFNYVILDPPSGAGLTQDLTGNWQVSKSQRGWQFGGTTRSSGFTTVQASAPTAFGVTSFRSMKQVTSESALVGGQLTGIMA